VGHDRHRSWRTRTRHADPIRVDSADPDDPVAQPALILLALFDQVERTCTAGRHPPPAQWPPPRGATSARPGVVDPDRLACAVDLHAGEGCTVAEIVAKTGITRTSPYRHVPPRPAVALTAALR